MKKSTILIATTNQGKYTEICEFLADLPFNFISLSDLKKIPAEPEEIGETIAENAILKARYYGQKTKLLTLADDTGLFVSALKGWPGVNSARVAATDQGKMDLLLKKMVIIPEEKRTATFRSAIAFCDSINNRLHLVIGELPGKIMLTPSKKRNLGYGYDPIFFVNEKNKPYSEMGLIEKNGCSHRGRALLQMKYFLQNNYDAKQCVAPIALIIKGGKIYLQKRHDPFNPEFHDKWATFVREHPTEWKVYHNEFINAEIEMRQNFVECLAQQPGGKEKVREVYGITNPNAYPKLLG